MRKKIVQMGVFSPNINENVQFFQEPASPTSKYIYTGKRKYSELDVILEKGDRIVQQPAINSQYDYKEFMRTKQIRESQVRKFKKEKKERKKDGGFYILNNWISDEKVTCQIPSQGPAYLAHLIMKIQFSKAQQYANTLPQSLELSVIKNILIKFKNILTIIRTSQMDVKNAFLERKQFAIQLKEQFKPDNYINLLNGFEKNKFYQNTNIDHKKWYINQNMKMVTQFIQNFDIATIKNDYLKMILYFLGNNKDQVISGDYRKILQNLKQLKLTDRLNFSQMLLTADQKKQFIEDLNTSLTKLPYLQNLYYFEAKDKDNQARIEQIFSNYLKQSNNLQTVAYLSLQYKIPSLQSYVKSYRQKLLLSLEKQELNKFLAEVHAKKWNFQAIKYPINPYQCHFFDQLKLQQDKFAEPCQIVTKKIQKCSICYQNAGFTQNQIYVQCSKCKHGGHLQHILNWFEKFNFCPKIDCYCTCN